MKIERQTQGSLAVLRATGRLDATWADHFHNAVQEAIRDGCQHVRIDASAMDYLSSAGIRALLKARRELVALAGSFGLVRPTAFVAETLRLSGLDELLLPDETLATAPRPEPPPPPAASIPPPAGMEMESFRLTAGGRILARSHAGWTPWQPVAPAAAMAIEFPRTRFGLGIGAPGRNEEEARTRYGEFVAAAGCVAWLPGDGAERPDYLEQAERFVPGLHAVQALTGEGAFSRLLRFRPAARNACLHLTDLFERVLAETCSESAALVALAEVEGLVGAALMVTHSMQQAVQLPERIVMMHRGRIVRQYAGQEKDRVRVPDLLAAFDRVRRREQLDAAVAERLGRQYA